MGRFPKQQALPRNVLQGTYSLLTSVSSTRLIHLVKTRIFGQKSAEMVSMVVQLC